LNFVNLSAIVRVGCYASRVSGRELVDAPARRVDDRLSNRL
jgi:hypothetical protein